MGTIGFLSTPPPSPEADELFDQDIGELGYVMNVSRLWAYQPRAMADLFSLMRTTISGAGLSRRERGIVVAACASAFGDSYCSLAWGSKLAGWADAPTAAAVLRGDDRQLSESERALAGWARKVARNPNQTSDADVQSIRQAGYSDERIFAVTAFAALRVAFSTVNDALGTQPDAHFRLSAPEEVLDAVTWGRPIDGADEPASGDAATAEE